MKKTFFNLLMAASAIVQAEQPTYKFILPTGPGSGTDTIVDIYSTCLEKNNISAIKEFKPGANGLIAVNTLRQSKDTPKTTSILAGSFGLNMLSNFPGVNMMEDIHPIVYGNSFALALGGKPGKIETIDDIRTLSKTRPINAGSSSVTGNFFIETLFKEAGIPYQIVPYKNSVSMLTDVVNGSVDVIFDTYAGSKSMVEAGKIKIIASTYDKKTAAKLNHESIHAYSKSFSKFPLGIIFSVNPGVSQEVKTTLINQIQNCNKDPDTVAKLDAIDSPPLFHGPDDIKAIYKWVNSKK
jgi:tripartite-type tricarboxylate transporter receptor subunit TctC